MTGVDFVVANSDAQVLNRSGARTLVQLGGTGRVAAEEAIDRIKETISGAHMLFITAGMGGRTGTGAARRQSSPAWPKKWAS